MVGDEKSKPVTAMNNHSPTPHELSIFVPTHIHTCSLKSRGRRTSQNSCHWLLQKAAPAFFNEDKCKSKAKEKNHRSHESSKIKSLTYARQDHPLHRAQRQYDPLCKLPFQECPNIMTASKMRPPALPFQECPSVMTASKMRPTMSPFQECPNVMAA
eukprot:c22285_g2_i1 orf=283-753(-)